MASTALNGPVLFAVSLAPCAKLSSAAVNSSKYWKHCKAFFLSAFSPHAALSGTVSSLLEQNGAVLFTDRTESSSNILIWSGLIAICTHFYQIRSCSIYLALIIRSTCFCVVSNDRNDDEMSDCKASQGCARSCGVWDTRIQLRALR